MNVGQKSLVHREKNRKSQESKSERVQPLLFIICIFNLRFEPQTSFTTMRTGPANNYFFFYFLNPILFGDMPKIDEMQPIAVDMDALSKKKPEETTFAELVSILISGRSDCRSTDPLLILFYRALSLNSAKPARSSNSLTRPKSKCNPFLMRSRAKTSSVWLRQVQARRLPLRCLSFSVCGITHKLSMLVLWLPPGKSGKGDISPVTHPVKESWHIRLQKHSRRLVR